MSASNYLGPFIVSVEGTALSALDCEMLSHPLVGGVILFSRNYQSMTQLKALVSAIREIKTPRLLVTVDQEGGRVQRFIDGFTRLPSLRDLGKLCDEGKTELVSDTALLMAQELLDLGIDMSFAPVLDVDMGVSDVIGSRSFHSSPEVLSNLAKQYISGMSQAGMAACGKHFPGHGAVVGDSHTDAVMDARTFAELRALDLVPYSHLATSVESIMTAHVSYQVDDATPATFSSYWLKQILRGELGFNGVIISDDLTMGAAIAYEPNTTHRIDKALTAGCDALLLCNLEASEYLHIFTSVPAGLIGQQNCLSALYGQPKMLAKDLTGIKDKLERLESYE